MTLKAQSLHKRYGQKTVIEDVSLSVERGEIIGLPVSYTHLTLPTIA